MLEVSTSYTKGPPYYHNWNYNKTIQIQTDCPIYCLIQSKLIANESLIILFILYILRDFLQYSDHTHPLILGMAVGDNGMMRDIFYPDESQPDLCFSPDYWWRMSRWLPTWWHSGSWRSPGWIKPKTSPLVCRLIKLYESWLKANNVNLLQLTTINIAHTVALQVNCCKIFNILNIFCQVLEISRIFPSSDDTIHHNHIY